MVVVLCVVVAVVLAATYVTWIAGRIDRLHVRVEAARAALDAQLLRRAGVAAELAAYVDAHGLVADHVAAALVDAAHSARAPDVANRDDVENDLSRQLRAAVAGIAATPMEAHPRLQELLADLETAATRVGLARSFYNGAVESTRTLRATWLVRWLHLAGHAPLPAYFEIDDAAFPVAATAGGEVPSAQAR